VTAERRSARDELKEKELAPMVAKAGREISSRLGYDLARREA
jgi:hypothetical protein